MSEAKFTPKPWILNEAHRGYVITAKDGAYDVAVVRNVGNENNWANANLIVAAPEMYEALKEITDVIKDHDLEGEFGEEAAKVIRAAIAKAEGRS